MTNCSLGQACKALAAPESLGEGVPVPGPPAPAPDNSVDLRPLIKAGAI